jgi:hypothetical protein
MTIWKNVNGKGVGIPAEELENLELEQQDKLYAERANQQQDEPDVGDEMDAIEYYDENKKYSDEELDQDVAFAKNSVEARKKADAEEGVNGMDAISYWNDNPSSTTPAPEKIVGSTGTYGTLKNENFSAYRAQRDAERKRNQEAIRAGRQAEADKRDELLATGRFFDDGRGNIKMKKEYRKQGMNGDRNTLRHFNKDTEHNTYADATNRMIKAAGQAAFNNGFEGALRRQEEERAARGRAKTNAIVESNEFELAQMRENQKQQGINLAKSHLGIYDGLVAAYKALDSDYNVSATHRDEQRSGELRDKEGRLIGYGAVDKKQVYADNDGIRVQEGENGSSVRNGFVGVGTIDEINKNLRKNGNTQFKITGIIARQKIDAVGNKAAPMFYVQGIRADGTQFGKTMSMKEVYNFGKENYINSGETEDDAENNVIDTFADVFGVRKRAEMAKMRDPKYRESVAKAKLAEYKAENPNWLTFDERMQLQASQNQNRLAIAQLNAEQRQKAAEAARVLKELGYAIDIDLAEAKAADASARSMANAKTGITNEAKYTPEQIEAEKKRAEEARKRARGKVGSRQANPSSGDNRTMPTVAKDTNSITMPDGKVVKKNETYTDSRGRTMRWVGPGPKDWKIVK